MNNATNNAYLRITTDYHISQEIKDTKDYIELRDIYLDTFEPNDNIDFKELYKELYIKPAFRLIQGGIKPFKDGINIIKKK